MYLVGGCVALCKSEVLADHPLHTARAPNLKHDLITAKVRCVIPKQSD